MYLHFCQAFVRMQSELIWIIFRKEGFTMKKACIFLADGFETIEGLTVVDVLRRAGIETWTVSVKESKNVVTSNGISLQADKLFDEVDYDEMDILILPGGTVGTDNLNAHHGVKVLTEKFAREGKYVAAICAAPGILGDMGLLRGKKAVCHPSRKAHLKDALFIDEPAVCDGNIITGRAMAASLEFALLILEKLAGGDAVSLVNEGIVYRKE